MERSTRPVAAAFGNGSHGYIGNNTRRGRIGARNRNTREAMGRRPGNAYNRPRNRSRSRNRRPLRNLPGLTSNINLGPANNPVYNGPNYLNAMPGLAAEDPFKNYKPRVAASRRNRSPSMPRNTRRRPFNRDPSFGRTNASPKEVEIVQYISRTLTKIVNKYEARYGAHNPHYVFVYSDAAPNSLGTGSQLRPDGVTVDVVIHVPPAWQHVMENYYKPIHVAPAGRTMANLKELQTLSHTVDQVKNAISTSHYNV